MIQFPSWFFTTLVYAGIVMASLGGLALLGLLIGDLRGKRLW